jgi:hypothetical protein
MPRPGQASGAPYAFVEEPPARHHSRAAPFHRSPLHVLDHWVTTILMWGPQESKRAAPRLGAAPRGRRQPARGGGGRRVAAAPPPAHVRRSRPRPAERRATLCPAQSSRFVSGETGAGCGTQHAARKSDLERSRPFCRERVRSALSDRPGTGTTGTGSSTSALWSRAPRALPAWGVGTRRTTTAWTCDGARAGCDHAGLWPSMHRRGAAAEALALGGAAKNRQHCVQYSVRQIHFVRCEFFFPRAIVFLHVAPVEFLLCVGRLHINL